MSFGQTGRNPCTEFGFDKRTWFLGKCNWLCTAVVSRIPWNEQTQFGKNRWRWGGGENIGNNYRLTTSHQGLTGSLDRWASLSRRPSSPTWLTAQTIYLWSHGRTRQGGGGGGTALRNSGKTVGEIWAKQEEKKLCVKSRANQPLCPP